MTRSRGFGGADALPVHLDRNSGIALPVQLAAALREAIDAAMLRPGEVVPSTREFARRLGVARGVVVAAYEQLIAEGYLAATHGQGTRVNPVLASVMTVQTSAPCGENAAEGSIGLPARTEPGALAPGRPITEAVDGAAWRAAWRAAASRAHLAAPELGDSTLREEIADHLRRMRGTARSASDVLVTAGTRDGLGLLLTALGTTHGHRLTVGVEDPGLPSLRGVVARYGARVIGLPTDAEGLETSKLPAGLLDAVIVTPSHQYPLGGSLPLTRRRELLAWAARTGVVIVEDDFDSELRYSGSPLPTLAALDDHRNGVVVLLGTFSRTIAPGISAGYLLAPERLRALIEPIRAELGGPVSTVVQEALARYLASGELRRHTARMLRRYAARRDAVSDVLAGVAGVRVRPMDGGLHAVVEFVGPGKEKQRLREAQALEGSEAAGLGAEALGSYWRHRAVSTSLGVSEEASASRLAGLVIGMGGSDDAEFDEALRTLRKILSEESATASSLNG